MGSCFNSSNLSRFQFRIDCTILIPKFLVILSLVAAAMARPQEQPANFACPNYPFCAIAANAPVPQQYQPHQDLYLAQRQAINQPLVADVPGIAQWYADLHAQQAAQGLNPGVTIHEAREAQVLMEQQRLLAYQAQGL